MEIQRVDQFDWSSPRGAAATVREVAAQANATDGVVNLNEHAVLHLKHRGLDGAALWVASGGGFALLRREQLDLVVAPDARRQGLGGALAEAALGGLDRVEAWSHGDHPGAARLAERYDLPRARSLLIMRRPASRPLEPVAAAPGVRIRAFEPGDVDAIVAVNAAAFVHHPEQGSMTVTDFRERAEEDWFEPEGLLVAVAEDDTVLGFHWTKMHSARTGEVYVVAVAPHAAGRGLGKLLTHAGLAHLANRGVAEVILYVDGDNAPAIAVYTGQGFEVARREVQYAGRPHLPG